MAVRIDAAADVLFRSTDLPAATPITIMGWLYLSVDRNLSGFIFELADSIGGFESVVLAADGTTLAVVNNLTNSIGTTLSLATWYHVTYTRNGATHKVLLNGVQDSTISSNNSLLAPTFLLFGSDGTNFINGRLAYCKLWTAELTAAEIQQEMRVAQPRRFANLYGWWPVLAGSGERGRDYSGNGRDMAEAGTLADEEGPPVSWGAPVLTLLGPNAPLTVTPSVVPLTSAALAATARLRALPSTPALATSALAATARLRTQPPAVALQTALLAPAPRLRVLPATTALTLTTPAPSVAVGGGATVAPDPVALSLTVLAPTPRLRALPAAVALSAAAQTAAARLRARPGLVTASLTLPAPRARLRSLPDVVGLSAALLAPWPRLRSLPGAVTLSLTLPAPSVQTSGATATPSTVALSLAAQAARARIRVSPATLALLLAALEAQSTLRTRPEAVVLTVTLLAPTVLQQGIGLAGGIILQGLGTALLITAGYTPAVVAFVSELVTYTVDAWPLARSSGSGVPVATTVTDATTGAVYSATTVTYGPLATLGGMTGVLGEPEQGGLDFQNEADSAYLAAVA